jgi:hypothetical protein
MGFFDKVFGGKTEGGPSPGASKGFRVHEDRETGFSISVPDDWSATGSPSGFEAHPKECSRVKGPGTDHEIASPGVTVSVVEIPDPRQNMIKETLRARAAELAGYRMVNHIASQVKNADMGIVYEFLYGPGEAPVHALGAVAQRKNRLFLVAACGASPDFDKNRGILEAVIMSFKLL